MTMNEAAMQMVTRAGRAQAAINELGAGRPDWADASQLSVADPEYLAQLDPPKKARRGTSNGNSSGSAEDRRRRKLWLLDTYRANEDALWAGEGPNAVLVGVPLGSGEKACRCFRCGKLVTFETMTVDRIIPGCQGGTYRRTNIRPCCGDCNSETGGRTRRVSKHRCRDCRREDPNDTRRPRPLVQWSGEAKCATHTR